jgi:DNA-directed RNA polymerase sigma subunit (sigma70/sigma32)
MTDPRLAFLAEARERGADPAAVAAMERLPAHLILTAVAIREYEDHRGTLNAVHELLALHVDRLERLADAAEAKANAAEAALRRANSHLRLVYSEPSALPPADFSYTSTIPKGA